jgi:hypothetical protein
MVMSLALTGPYPLTHLSTPRQSLHLPHFLIAILILTVVGLVGIRIHKDYLCDANAWVDFHWYEGIQSECRKILESCVEEARANNNTVAIKGTSAEDHGAHTAGNPDILETLDLVRYCTVEKKGEFVFPKSPLAFPQLERLFSALQIPEWLVNRQFVDVFYSEIDAILL